jgi:predicted protein tyrosine phosphatase
MLIVSSLADAPRAFARHRPARVISLVSDEDSPPRFAGVDPVRCLTLYVERETCGESIDAAARARAGEIIRFLKTWDGSGGVLVHCSRGVSRSTAAAYIILCMRLPEESEAALAQRLRRTAPYADPCPLLVSYADDLLGRGGRMIEAIEDLPPPAPVIAAPVAVFEFARSAASPARR